MSSNWVAIIISSIALIVSGTTLFMNYRTNNERRRGEIAKKLADHVEYIVRKDSEMTLFKTDLSFQIKRLDALNKAGEHDELLHKLKEFEKQTDQSLATIQSLKKTFFDLDIEKIKNSDALIRLQKIEIMLKRAPESLETSKGVIELLESITI